MSISVDTLQATAKLAYIELDDEIKTIQDKLSSIMKSVQTLQAVNTTNVTAFQHIHFTHQTMREDIVNCDNNRDTLENLAPKFNKDAYQIPIVINNTGK